MARRARVLISPELLREALHLPIGTHILGSVDCAGLVEITVEHPDLADVPIGDDERLPLASPKFRRQDAVVFVDWGL